MPQLFRALRPINSPVLTSFVCLLLLLSACSTEEKKETKGLAKFEEKLKPAEHLWKQRAYPDNHVNLKAMDKLATQVQLAASQKTADTPWTLEGPTNIGGRINALEVHPENSDIMYAGAAAGGLFKTTDNGTTWIPVGDTFSYLAISHIQFDPQDPSIVYVATGDPNISGLPHIGNGIYKSEDDGATWTNIGLSEQRIISKIAVHPTEQNTLYAGAMGLPFERNNDRGFYKTTDGGTTWEQTLLLDDDAGITDLKVNPQNPDIVFAAGWNRIRNNQESVIYGPESRIYRSTDGALTWDTLTVGLPTDTLCRIGLEMSQNDPNTLWAIIINQSYGVEGIYKTTDAGDSWTNLLTDPFALEGALGGFGWYFAKVRVNPWNEDEISVLGVDLWTSYDNGETWEMTTPPWWAYEVHADKHDMVYLSEETVLLATDGGLYKTTNHFNSWTDIEDIPNTQFYRIAVDPFNPGYYTGGAQDNGTTTGNEEFINDWFRDYGGDGFQCIYDYENDGIRYMETQNGNIVVEMDGFVDNFTNGIDEEDRRNWDMPYIMSSWTSSIMYTGTQRMYKHDGAPFSQWLPISEDLTDGNIFGSGFHTISTVADDPLDEYIVYAGTTDGNVWRGELLGDYTWTPLYDELPERWVTNIKASKETPSRLWVSHSGYKDNDQTAHLHRSDDEGATWTDVTGDLPEQPINHIETVNDTILFIATDFGVYNTLNGGDNWTRIGNNMPTIPVFDIEVDTALNTLVAGTFARGIWTFPTDSIYTITEVEDPDSTDNVLEAVFQDLRVFPNPAEDVVSIQAPVGSLVQLFTMQGQLILEEKILTPQLQLPLSALKSGKYVMLFTLEDRKTTQNLVKL